MIDDGALGAQDVANILNVSRKMVYELAKSGKISHYKIGRRMRFEAADVEMYLANVRVSAEVKDEGMPSGGADDSARSADDDSFVLAGQGIAADLFIDRLELMGDRCARRLRSSYSGLIDLYNGKVDAALTHLYDQSTDSYNIPYIQRLVPGMPVIAFRLVRRKQGFAVALDNPKKISTWSDLLRDGVRLANRSKGCGSRVLLDEKLLSIKAQRRMICGYDSDYPTGLAAAQAVSEGVADVAVIGEQIATRVEGVLFVPAQSEWLDIVVAKSDKGEMLARKLRALFEDKAFRKDYGHIVHGDTELFGSIVYEM